MSDVLEIQALMLCLGVPAVVKVGTMGRGGLDTEPRRLSLDQTVVAGTEASVSLERPHEACCPLSRLEALIPTTELGGR